METLNNNPTITSPSIIGDLYNLSMLEEMDDNEYVVEILTIFMKETPLELKEMSVALHNRKADIVSQKAHKIKSSAGVIQAGVLTEYLNRIEMLGKTGVINNELINLVEAAGQQYNCIEQALKKHIKGLY